MIWPGAAKTVGDHLKVIVENYGLERLRYCDIIDIVWDVYIEHSLKLATRELHGQGTPQRVVATTSIPHYWADVLKCSNSKKELFAFLTDHIVGVALSVGKEVFITSNDKVKCNPPDKDISRMSPCTHK